MKHLFVCVMILGSLSSPLVFAGAYGDLSPAQQAALQSGQQVKITQDVADKPWPKIWVYQRIEATPLEAAAVLGDYEYQTGFIPDLLQSKIIQKIDRATDVVSCTLHTPWPFANENYTVRNHLSSYDAGSSFRMDWTLVRADSVLSIEGYARFEPLGTATIMAYYSYVVPGTAGAGLVSGKAIQGVLDATQALVDQIEKEKSDDPARLQSQVQALQQAVL